MQKAKIQSLLFSKAAGHLFAGLKLLMIL